VGLMSVLASRWEGVDQPFLISGDNSLRIGEVLAKRSPHLDGVQPGEVVALIGDFDAQSIADLLTLVERRAVLVPLTSLTRNDHEYFFEAALVDWVIEDGQATKRTHQETHPLLDDLRARDHPGLVLFSTGTTGRPKAILHDMTAFLKRFETPRPTLRTMAFLLFDHIGGINTLLHTLFNAGVVITPTDRSVSGVLATSRDHQVEALPTTPTFLRMMLISGLLPEAVPDSLKIITYGTERMDQPTLDALCDLLPDVDFRQTFGMSELGIVRVKSQARDSLFMRIGGDGVQTRVHNGVLKILSETRMMGYLNAESPFDAEGWYDTKDVVETHGEFIKVVGRTSEVINVGGLKFMASEVERVALEYPGVALVSVIARPNPVTGQHIEMTVETLDNQQLDMTAFRGYLSEYLPRHMVPRRISHSKVSVGHRFKKS